MYPTTSQHRARLLAGLLLLALTLPAAAADWPQWRGLRRDGVAAETEIATRWGDDGPPVVWRRAIGGGFASVAAAGGRLYTQWSEDDTTFVVCLDAADGSEVWRFAAAPVYANERGSGPRATPTLDGDRLYAVTGSGKIHALAVADGRPLWSHDLVAEYGGELPHYGFSASPLVEGDLVLTPGGGAGRSLLAFHRDDGRLVWGARDDGTSYASPIAVDAAGRRQVVFVTGSHVVATTLQGDVLWTHEWPHDYHINVATPIFVPPSRIFVSTSYDKGAVVLEVAAGDGGLAVAPVWTSRVMKNHFQDSVLHDGFLYGFDNATLKCVRAADGEEMWRHRGLGKGSLVLAGGYLLALSERGKLVAAPVSPESFEVQSAAQVVHERCWTSPSLADGRLYVRTETELLSLDLRPASAAAGRTVAERAAPTPAPADAAELLARNTRARGGEERWAAAGALRLTGVLDVQGRQHRCTLLRRSADRLRLDCDFLDLRESYVVTGEKAWWKPLREEDFLTVPPPADKRLDFDLLLLRIELFAAALDGGRPDVTAELAAPSAGAEHEVRVTTADGAAESWFFDRATSQLVRKLRRFVLPNGERREYFIDYGDFRDAGGLVFPFANEVELGTMLYHLRVEEAEAGVAAGDELFQPR